MVESSSPEGNGRDQVEKVRVELVSCGEEEDQTEETQDEGLMTGSHYSEEVIKFLVEVIDIDEVVIEPDILQNESATNAQDQEKAWYADTSE